KGKGKGKAATVTDDFMEEEEAGGVAAGAGGAAATGAPSVPTSTWQRVLRARMRPLCPDAVLALGFPQMRCAMPSMLASVPGGAGGAGSGSGPRAELPVVAMLLGELHTNLSTRLTPV
ncbi:unnamed protein product, partial [Phaeothamnion confervicola]